jgi:carbonic anhydrase
MKSGNFALPVIVAIVVTACSSTSPQPASNPAPAPAAENKAAKAAAPHWTYEGEEGPDHWGSLSADFAACSMGSKQSPVDIAKREPKDLANIVFHYAATKARIENNGHTVQVNFDAGNSIEVDGSRYELAQFHLHAPSEHTVNGKHADADVHLVHRNAQGQLAVVGVLINKGTENSAIKSAWEKLPAQPGPAQMLEAPINPEGWLPAKQTTYRYEGSLTTPPCSEGVAWLVMTEPVQMSDKQLAAFTNLFKGNNRPVQPLHDRLVVEDTTP